MATSPASFEKDVRPLFRAKDINAMKSAFDLSSYEDVRAYANAILGRVAAGSMPCDGPWPQERVDVFRRWIDDGMKP